MCLQRQARFRAARSKEWSPAFMIALNTGKPQARHASSLLAIRLADDAPTERTVEDRLPERLKQLDASPSCRDQ